MPCAYPYGIKDNEGKPCMVPCGRCYGCRLDRAKEWSTRLMHEAKMHEDNCFLTLTYDNKNLPKNGSISKREMQLFMKKLRQKLEPKRIRFYGVGEYGEKLKRPHYHIILFNHDFEDKKFYRFSDPKKRNRFSSSMPNKIYTSDTLHKIWNLGLCFIGEVSIHSCGYVARYIRKKLGGDLAKKHYNGKTPEFALMSRGRKKGEGLGGTFLKNYWTDVYPKDFFTIDGKRFKPPKYYDKVLMRENWELFEKLKQERSEKVEDMDGPRRRQVEKYLRNVTNNLNRSYEDE